MRHDHDHNDNGGTAINNNHNLDELASDIDTAIDAGYGYDHDAIAARCRVYLVAYDAEHGPDLDKLRADWIDAVVRSAANGGHDPQLVNARIAAADRLRDALDA